MANTQQQIDRLWRIKFVRSHILKAAEDFARQGDVQQAAEYIAAVRKQEREGWPKIT